MSSGQPQMQQKYSVFLGRSYYDKICSRIKETMEELPGKLFRMTQQFGLFLHHSTRTTHSVAPTHPLHPQADPLFVEKSTVKPP